MSRYQVIYADPPWQYRDRKPRGGAEKHYSTLSTRELAAMPIADFAAPTCALFLWATWPNLPAALEVITAWGFVYKTCAFAWVKTTGKLTPAFGTGHYTRANTEPCLLAVRGRPQRVDAGVPQVLLEEMDEESILAPRKLHSAKPPEVRDRIVRLLGDVPRIELFAREHTPGWKAWGDQLPPLEATP